MDTQVMTQEKIIEELNELLQIDLDAVGAYQAAIDSIRELEIKDQLRLFQRDHERHVSELGDIIRRAGGTPKQKPDLTGMLRRGFTKVAGLVGAEACLRAMLSNEKAINAKYANHLQKGFPADVLDVLRHNYADEQRHLTWVDQAIRQRLWENPTQPITP